MLNLLIGYAEREGLVIEPGVERKAIKWLICCTEEGKYTGLVPLGEKKGESIICPVTPGMNAGGKSHFLAETLETVVLFIEDEAKRSSALAKHDYFHHLLDLAAQEIPVLMAGFILLQNKEQLERIVLELKQLKAKPTDNATFRIGDRIILRERSWRDWWRNKRQDLDAKKPKKSTSQESRCLITGELIVPAEIHENKIKGLTAVGGATGGDVIVGFDKDAFRSYGFEKSHNAPMSAETASAYAAGLNHLITQKGRKLGNTLAVYWYTNALREENDALSWLIEPPEQTAASAEALARGLLYAIRKGERPDLANNRYVALMLSGQAGRVMVRDVMQGGFEDLTEKVGSWFDDLSIVARDGKGLAHSPKFLAIAGSLVRDLKDFPSPWLRQLWHAALTNGPIPAFALAQAVLRARIDVINDSPASHARMGLLKAFHIRKRDKGDKAMTTYLNPEHPDPAYHCGRLLAVFSYLQWKALGDVGAGVVQRYYTAASQTPGLVLGRLAANAKNHLGKLEKNEARNFEFRIAEVMSQIRDRVPRTLTLEEQSLFALGYYQQLAFRPPKSDKDAHKDTDPTEPSNPTTNNNE
jgi:CRISPR-associated protein Csd1